MANLEQSGPEGSALPAAADPGAGISAKGAQRRRFAKAGAGASGSVLLTLASQPAMAIVCTSPSGTVSGNTSRPSTLSCEGRSPGFWKEKHEAWSSAATNGDALFKLTFYCGGRCTALAKYTCFDIVDPQLVANGDDPNNVAMHMMATLLNVRSKRIGFLTEQQVLAMWYSYAQTGTYTPTIGVSWGGAKIVSYLTSTMI